MFDLEKSITDWRRQMLSGGVKAPVPLDELESHLREEIERQIQSGAGEREAFQRTVLQIGQPKELKAEFAKDRNLLSFFGTDKFQAIDRILGTVWLVFCARAFVAISSQLIHHLAQGTRGPVILIGLLLWAFYGAVVLASVLVIRGSKLGRRIVGIVACLLGLLSLCFVLHLFPTGPKPTPFSAVSAFTAFYAMTVWLMFLPRHSNMKPARQ